MAAVNGNTNPGGQIKSRLIPVSTFLHCVFKSNSARFHFFHEKFPAPIELLWLFRLPAASLPTINNPIAGKKYASPTKQIHFLKRNKSKQRGRARLPGGVGGQSITHALDLPPLADTCFSTPRHFSTLDEVLMVVRGCARFFLPSSRSALHSFFKPRERVGAVANDSN